MTVRAKIDAGSGLIELEGEETFVVAQLEKLLPIITHPRSANKNIGANRKARDARQPKGRRRPPPAPKGESCRDRIKKIRDDGFFAEKQTPSDIVGGLAKAGWTHDTNQVTATLTNMFSSGEIRRTKEGRGFKYFWDR